MPGLFPAYSITSKMLYAGNKPGTPQSGCYGDSGGPYVCTEDGEH